MSGAVYWVGQDNNVWLKGPSGTQNLGPAGTTNWNLNNGGFESNTLGQSVQATRIADPNPPAPNIVPTSNSSSGGTSGGVRVASGSSNQSSLVDPAVAALLGGQISDVRGQIGQLPGQLNQALGDIQSSENQAVNNENQSYSDAFGSPTSQYNTTRNNTIQNMLQAKEQINQGVNQNTNFLQRLLGLAGSGNSSAAEVLAPFAASQAGNTQNQTVQNTYGQNLGALDLSAQQGSTSHNHTLADLQQQLFQNQQSAREQNASTHASLLSALAGLTGQQSAAAGKSIGEIQSAESPLLQQLQSIRDQMGGFNAKYQAPIAPTNPVTYSIPTPSSYTFGSIGAPTAGASPGGQPLAPYLGTPPQQKQQPGASLIRQLATPA